MSSNNLSFSDLCEPIALLLFAWLEVVRFLLPFSVLVLIVFVFGLCCIVVERVHMCPKLLVVVSAIFNFMLLTFFFSFNFCYGLDRCASCNFLAQAKGSSR